MQYRRVGSNGMRQAKMYERKIHDHSMIGIRPPQAQEVIENVH